MDLHREIMGILFNYRTHHSGNECLYCAQELLDFFETRIKEAGTRAGVHPSDIVNLLNELK